MGSSFEAPLTTTVIPAQAGIPNIWSTILFQKPGIPAFTGMTVFDKNAST
jgi:hypothetical protein